MRESRLRLVPRGQQLVARRPGRIEHRIGVVLAVAQQVAAPGQSRDHLFSYFIFINIHGIYSISLRHRALAPDGIELVAPGPPADSAPATRLRVPAGATDRQGLAIDDRD